VTTTRAVRRSGGPYPALAKQDAKPYKALRTWALQFYDEPPASSV
jgi:hypothetical protein